MLEEISVKILDIPAFIDLYNHYMNVVDNADQLRYFYSTPTNTFRNSEATMALRIEYHEVPLLHAQEFQSIMDQVQ